MTDDEINRKVAERRGFTIRETHEECSGYVPGAVWVSGGDYYEQIVTWCIPNAYIEAWDNSDNPQNELDWYQYCGVSDVCNDPAAWGALFVEMHKQGLEPELDSRFPDGDEAFGALAYESQKCNAQRGGGPRRVIECWADSPGRALALAYIAASEVTK